MPDSGVVEYTFAIRVSSPDNGCQRVTPTVAFTRAPASSGGKPEPDVFNLAAGRDGLLGAGAAELKGRARPLAHRISGVDKVATRSYLETMRSVGLKTLKNRLSEYVRLAAGGETVLVTDRDRVVAELVPPRADRGERLADALLAEAVRKGWISAPLLVAEGDPPRAPVAPLADILGELARDRADR
jgi:antitoxin (DNA-binding transcriptional repressor) of toxin-antitoxin stability system